MGRSEPSVGQPPAGFRRDARAKKAKATINQLIPSLLPTHPQARRGIDAAELIVNPPTRCQTEARPRTSPSEKADATAPRLALIVGDTLTVARRLKDSSRNTRMESRIAILNMASPLSPGGGFLNGASSQEESLCMRTTLLPSLRDNYYRLPEVGAIYTPDVMVFRDENSDDVLPKRERWFVDCITAAMLRSPETERDELERGRYVNDKDRDLVLQKMRMVLRICQIKEIKKVVLGAWGCGAYGNPVGEIAAAWRKVLLPKMDKKSKGKSKKEIWDGIEEVVFAIKDPGMAEAFATAFGPGLEQEEVSLESDVEETDEGMNKVINREEIQERIKQLEGRMEMASNPNLKAGFNSVLEGLRAQLAKEGPEEDEEEDVEELEEDELDSSEDGDE